MRMDDDGDDEVDGEEGRVTGTGGLKPGRSKVVMDIFRAVLNCDDACKKLLKVCLYLSLW